MVHHKKNQDKLSFEQAKQLVREFKVFTAKEYLRFRASSTDFKKVLPYQPSIYYKNEWKGWCNFTGMDNSPEVDFNIEEIQQIAVSLNIRTKEEWRLAVSTNLINGPLHISKVDGFSNWAQFLAHDKYLNFKDLLSFTRKLGLRTQTDWRQWCRDNDRPDNVPFDLHGHYKTDFQSITPAVTKSFWHYLFVEETSE